ncbi:cupin domain-containing protein [Mucilaginibacter limnophilus]|uniref:Cupin domain-containing protein n=1 Tax=Mucilaginibacter limnophilus TaxID=1932778 RepID=A0A3S2UML9_9SPHI|nr:cupin domain-containing protein [Mucilaginibacter limnophilus]RVT98495.1 cupin domain-containing protein [Mucilaginibacter limnophilus]
MEITGSFGFFDDEDQLEREAAERVLPELLALKAIKPPDKLKNNLMGRLGFETDVLSLSDLPAADKYANHLSWLKVLAPFIPKIPVETIFMHEFQRNKNIVQALVITKVDVPEEVHEEYAESFFILEGRCACTVGDNVFELGPGDHLPIPLHIPHDVRLLSPQVTAVVQYQLS